MCTKGHTIGLQSFIKFPYFVLELQRGVGALCESPQGFERQKSPGVIGLNSSKNDAFSILINEVICTKLPRRVTKSTHFQKKLLITQKLLEEFIRKMTHCQRLYYRRIVENFLVCHTKIGGAYTKKIATENHRFAATKKRIIRLC